MESITQILQRQAEKVSNFLECFREALLPGSSVTYRVIAGGSSIATCHADPTSLFSCGVRASLWRWDPAAKKLFVPKPVTSRYSTALCPGPNISQSCLPFQIPFAGYVDKPRLSWRLRAFIPGCKRARVGPKYTCTDKQRSETAEILFWLNCKTSATSDMCFNFGRMWL